MTYISQVILPESNKVRSFTARFKEILLEEFMRFMSLMYTNQVVKLPS